MTLKCLGADDLEASRCWWSWSFSLWKYGGGRKGVLWGWCWWFTASFFSTFKKKKLLIFLTLQFNAECFSAFIVSVSAVGFKRRRESFRRRAAALELVPLFLCLDLISFVQLTCSLLCRQLVFVGFGAVCSALRWWSSALHHRAGEFQHLYCADDWAAAARRPTSATFLLCFLAESQRNQERNHPPFSDFTCKSFVFFHLQCSCHWSWRSPAAASYNLVTSE